MLDEAEASSGVTELTPIVPSEAARRFWEDFLVGLKLDDPEQPIPRPARQGQLNFMLPAQSGSSWLTVYRNMKRGEVGVTFSSHRDTPGDYARQAIVDEWDAVKDQLGGTAKVIGLDPNIRVTSRRLAFVPCRETDIRHRKKVAELICPVPRRAVCHVNGGLRDNAKDGWRARNAVTQAVIQSMDGKPAHGEDM